MFSYYSFCVFSVGAFALVMPRGYSMGFVLMCIAALVQWLRKRPSLIDYKNKYLLGPCLIYGLGNMAVGLLHQWTWRAQDPYLPFILIPLGFWGVRRYRPSAIYFWSGLAFGAVGAACIAGYQALILGIRADGFNHAIQFGNAALLMGILCLVCLLTVRLNKWIYILILLGTISGLLASVWSQTRGGWVALGLILIWMINNGTRGWHPVKRKLAVLAMLTLLIVPAIHQNGIVQQRVMTAVYECRDYYLSNVRATSVGARLMMWTFASKDIASAPLIGQGVEGWKRNRDAGVQSGALDPFVKDFSHLHNEFLDVTYKTGFLGLALLLGLYWGPLLMFFKPYLHGYGSEVKALAMGGMVLPMMYMDFGLTQTFLSHNSGRMVFVSLLMCFGALLLNAVEDE